MFFIVYLSILAAALLWLESQLPLDPPLVPV